MKARVHVKFVLFLSSCGCRLVDAQRSKVVAPIRFQCLISLENSPVDIFGRLEKTTEFYNGFGYRQSFTGWVSVHYRHHKHPACIRSLWGLCWTGVYWITVTFLEGCNSKLHFFYEMKLIFLPTPNHTPKRGYLLSQPSYTCLGVCVWMVGSFRPDRSLLWRLQAWEKAQQSFTLVSFAK